MTTPYSSAQYYLFRKSLLGSPYFRYNPNFSCVKCVSDKENHKKSKKEKSASVRRKRKLGKTRSYFHIGTQSPHLQREQHLVDHRLGRLCYCKSNKLWAPTLRKFIDRGVVVQFHWTSGGARSLLGVVRVPLAGIITRRGATKPRR